MQDGHHAQGGRARAAKLSKEERRKIAQEAARARWDAEKALPVATHGGDHPLTIGDVEIDCYVLDDRRRVISQRGMYRGLGVARGGARNESEAEVISAEIPRFAAGAWIRPHISDELAESLANPSLFKLPSGARGYGYPATALQEFCDAVLAARLAGDAGPRQAAVVAKAELLLRGFARVGIVALVDEATGFQAERDRAELHRILEAYLTDERLAWAKRFPDEFYRQIYRLKGWAWPPVGGRRPGVLGHMTNDIVYDRLPPGLLDELRRRNPTDDTTKRRRFKHHQFLSEDFGQPDLQAHILQVVAAMKMSKTWEGFKRRFDEAFPRPGTQMAMDLDEGD